jgi:hypothetical protein
MNLIVGPSETLPTLIDKATAALEGARNSAEILEAREMARVAYNAAKSAARIMKAKTAHDNVVAGILVAQAEAVAIRARAEMRLAEEYDAGKAAGDIAAQGQRNDLLDASEKVPTARDFGLRHDEIHEARKIRDAEAADPGAIDRAMKGILDRGDEPTRAALHRELMNNAQKPMDKTSLWLWGRLRDFDRMDALTKDPQRLLAEMTEPMRRDMRDVVPRVRAFLEEMEQHL